MVAGVISSTEPRNPPRDRPNNVGSGQRRPTRGKQVPSRYLSPSPSHSLSSSSTTTTTTTSSSSSSAILKTTKRHPSPLLPRPTNSASNPIKTPSLLSKRSQSVDRRRPSAAPAEVSAATKMLITSTRSLSVSFQGEAFSLPVSKKKEASPPMGYLEEWSLLDRDHTSSLSGATQALKASTLRLPIVGKTVVDIKDLKHAVSSAVDVMQAMSSSIFSLTLKVDEMNSVMVETVNVTAKEKVLLERCQGFLSRVAAMQVIPLKDHSSSLSGATQALKASTLRLPIVGKTVVDIKDLKHAVSSAVDVMQAMSSSIFSLTLKVDEMNSVMVETVNVTAKEKVLLERCQGFLSRVAAMQVTDCSVKTHIIQLRPITSSLTS
ncbi:hypothetical protein F2Q70_00013680 [Brassica cretica]|uniref:Protein SNOWY COTYLEDON 3 n=1 Tax=Brassica cretica TaxID=69181 RepID=A0A8S9MAM6_BRACR|nr:hypothetical protein F2Q70_00013680 [Brassica cretica]